MNWFIPLPYDPLCFALYRRGCVGIGCTLLRSRGVDVTTVPEQATLGRTDREQLEFATSLGRCILTHNRVDFERLHLQYIEEDRTHAGIIVVPQKNAYEFAQRVGILVSILMTDQVNDQLLYA